MFPNDSDYETKVTLESNRSGIVEDLPFHILIPGDWSGREGNHSNSEPATWRPIEIDRDNFDEVLSRLDVTTNLDFQGAGGNVLTLRFASLDDFHPNSIFQRMPLFEELRELRRQLKNPKTYNRAAREVKSWLVQNEASENVESDSSVDSSKQPAAASGNLLDAILNESGDENVVSRNTDAPTSELGAFIKNIVSPHLVRIDADEQSEMLGIIDEIVSDLMRKVLHHPRFQSLEAAWRAAYFLVRRADTNSDLKIYLLDIGKSEIVSDLKSVSVLTESKWFRLLQQNEPSWSVVCADYTFSLNVEDAATLIRLSQIAARSRIAFVSHIKPEMFGFDSFAAMTDYSETWKIKSGSVEEKLWTALRAAPETEYLALGITRVLARLPYGSDTEPTETFHFEEFFSSSISHEEYLWFNPAFAAAVLLAQTYSEFGWDITQNFITDLEDLPLHFCEINGERATKPCAETALTQTNYETLVEQGILPVISYKNSDRIKVSGLRPVAYSAEILKGKWG